MSVRTLLAVIVAMLTGALGYRMFQRSAVQPPESPLFVIVNQMRTRALIEHEREITVWYKTCPEVPGIDPQVLVIWPGKLSYELDLAATKLELRGDVLRVTTPPIRADEPQVPTELGEYIAQSSLWTLPSDQQLVLNEMQKASPLARHLSAYYLRYDSGLVEHFRDELGDYLRGLAGALKLRLARIEIDIPRAEIALPARPPLALCKGSLALANGAGFARRQSDGTEIGIYPAAGRATEPRTSSR